MPNTALKVLQIGQEGTTYGTIVAATAKLAGVEDVSATWQPNNIGIPEQGRMGPSANKFQGSRMGMAKVNFFPTFNQLHYLGHGYFGSVASSGTSGSGQFNWTYTAPTTATETPTVYTLEVGAPSAVRRLTGAVGSKFKLAVEAGDHWKAEMEFLGKDVSTTGGALTALSDTAWLPMRAADTVLYVDTSGGTIGSTTLSSVLIAAELEVDTKRHLKLFAGTTTPSNYGTHQWTGTLKLSLEATTPVLDIIDASKDGIVERQIQLSCVYTTNYTNKIQFAGFLTGDLEFWKDRDGNMFVDTVWQGNHSTALGAWLKMVLTNGTSVLT